MWVGDYDTNHELRKLRPLGKKVRIARYLKGVPIINRDDDWEGFCCRARISSHHELIVSEKCLQSNAPYTLETYAVHREILKEGQITSDGDVILLGEYKNRPGVFLASDAVVNVRD